VSAKISGDEVRAAVQKFWDILAGKSAANLEDMYAPGASVFTGRAKRSEAGLLAAARRMRNVGGRSAGSVAEIDPIEVQLPENDVAIASYTYRFHASRTRKDGSREQRNTLFGRSTQIFQRDERGALKIVHEHLSSAAPPKVESAAGG
jgi:ketosteroid isomerase-like protein